MRATCAGVRSNVIPGSSDGARRTVTALDRANSRSPSSPWIRPKPESPIPPNGSVPIPTKVSVEFTATMPVRSRRAIRTALALPKTAPPSPYGTALALLIASSALATLVIVSVGPNVSSRTADESSGTSTSTVGATFGGCTASVPPSTALPPRARASSMCRRMTSIWAGIVIGPISSPSFNLPAFSTTAATNLS